ncbi:insulinase family protein [Ligilactobacillus agilis]|uniref:EF-P 5-aminopentanol modification-associated protein YfmF n=1 Tax=Ligilactobacillus agilis TaxID=1601 RepID=UPI00067F3F87|nr:pitrilysin family protein [Ligilactobacillus agilis]UNL42204.1 insulinase family protein [Ligilactobacillus agilis]UNL58304.1 insulinase family protein [Ligilactobacillus agilis]
MQVQIVPGVTLDFIASKQFKTSRINLTFVTANVSKKTVALRTLIANMLEVSSQKYPDQKAISDQLAFLYGATFGTSVNRRGNLHLVNFEMRVVNDHYLKEKQQLLTEAINFLQELIFNPLVTNQAFDQAMFTLQQKNLIAYLESIKDNKQAYALQKLQQAYFEDPVHQIPPYGDKENLAALTAAECYAYYQEMLAHDEVIITLSGDFASDEVLAAIAQLKFTPRTVGKYQLTYKQTARNKLVAYEEQQDLNQSKLDLAYHFPVEYRGKYHYAALVFNALFGGSALSKLFTNVREKASLAYYANSSFDSLRQVLFVQTGIQADKKQQVLDLIEQQLAALVAGDVEAQLLANIKQELITDYEIRQDSQATALIQATMDQLSQSKVTASEWKAAIMAVSVADVQAVAALAKLEVSYFLKGQIN